MLKDWLVRRRDNPYPSRDEKKRLAVETGLTYTQICNWFANWRRKLKNSERERNERSWGHLIKNYNTNTRGNVEQFSISSEDSIWEENEFVRDGDEMKRSDDDDEEYESREDGMNSCNDGTLSSSAGYSSNDKNQPTRDSFMKQQFCYNRNIPNFKSSSAILSSAHHVQPQPSNYTKPTLEAHRSAICNAKYKQKMMEKYLRDMNDAHLNVITQRTAPENDFTTNYGTKQQIVNETDSHPAQNIGHTGSTALTKWLESAARFTPDKNNYFIEWNGRTGKLERKPCSKQLRCVTIIPAHSNILQRQPTKTGCPTQLEMDAAEALANMAFNCRQRMLDCNNNSVGSGSLQTVKAISS
ncbi:iroquois-class homeodomain protein irx-3 isoform X2 [Eurosta solidaginis]